MTYIMGQVQVAADTVPLFTIPPGLCNFIFYQTGTGTVFTGTSTAVTTTNGMQCFTVPVPTLGYVSGKGATVYGVSTGTAVVHYLISTDQF